jgi:MFS family permease
MEVGDMTFTVLGKGRFHGWFILGLTAVLYFLMCGIFMYSFGLFLPFLCKEFAWSRGAVSGANAAFMALGGLCGPLVGIFIAKYGARRAWVMGNALGAAGLVLLAFHSRLWQLYCAYGVLIGLGMGFGGILTATAIANNWFERKRSLAFAIILASGGIGGLVLVPVLMRLIEHVGWRMTYGIMAAIILVFSVMVPSLFLINKPEDLGQVPDGDGPSKPAQGHAAAPLREVYRAPVDFTAGEALRTPAFWIVNVVGVLQVFVMTGLLAHQVSFLVDVGLATSVAATAMGVLAGVSTVGRLGIGFLGLRYNMRPLVMGAFTVYAIGIALALVTRSQFMAFVYSALVGMGFGAAVVSIMNLFPVYFGKTHYPKIVGFGSPLAIIGGSTGAPIFGYLRDITGSYALPFQIAFFALIAGVVLLILAPPPVHPSLKAGSGQRTG